MRLKAVYKKHKVPQLCGNPLTEALAIIYDKEALMKSVEQKIEAVEFWSLETIYQQTILQGFAQIHVSTPQFYSLYSKLISLLLHTYGQVHPFSADSNRNKYKLASFTNDRKAKWKPNVHLAGRTTASSLIVHGLSGVGKTTEIRAALSCITQVIEHHQYNGHHYRQDQLVWISIDLPSTPSIKALALNFFLAVDNALGCTNYYEEWSKKSNASVDRHLNAMRQVAIVHELGLVHIDELQFMLKYAKSKDSPTLQTLEALFNKIGIPIILSCTTQGLALFDMCSSPMGLMQDMTTTRRMLNDREYKFDVHKITSPYFKRLFDALFPKFLLWPGTTLNEEFFHKFHLLSCGLPAIMTRLAHMYHETHLQLRARSSGRVPSATKLLESVYEHQFRLIDPALTQLRRNRIEQYEKVLTNDGEGKAAFTDNEKKHRAKKESKALRVQKGGLYDKDVAVKPLANSIIQNGFK